MLQSVLGAFSCDMALDLGTSTTRIVVLGRGLVCSEPSAVAIHEPEDGPRRVLAVGRDAHEMLGRTPADIRVVRPIQDGVIDDYEVAEAMLRQLMVQVQGRRLWVGPRVAVCIPHGTTEVERRAVRECCEAAGAREVRLVEHPLAAALGAELPVHEAQGHMVIDVGGGTTTVAVLSLGGIVYCRTLKVGGNQLDAAIVHHLRERHGVLIGPRTAESVKIQLGRATGEGAPLEMLVKGRDLETGFPRAARVDSNEVRDALAEPLRLVVEAVIASLEHTPPDLAADIAATGLVLTGGSALLPRLDRALGDATGLPVVAAEEPAAAVVRGAARSFEEPELLLAAAG